VSTRPDKPKATVAPPITGGNATVSIINQAMALMVQAKAMVQPILRGPFTPRENLALTKSKHAVKVLAPGVIQTAIQKPNLAPDSLTPADLQSQLEVSAAVLTFANQMSGFNGQVDDTSRSMQADNVKVALDVYAIAERSPSDADAQTLVSQMKEALATGPRFPRKKVTTLPRPVTMVVPAEAAAAAQAAVDAQQQAASSSTGSSTPATPAGTPTAPQVPVFTPGGEVGTAAATNGK
jgi:hypothetical protein